LARLEKRAFGFPQALYRFKFALVAWYGSSSRYKQFEAIKSPSLLPLHDVDGALSFI